MRRQFGRAISAAVAVGCWVALCGVGFADLVGPEGRACQQQKEGDICDQRLEGRAGYRGVCVRADVGEGRSRLRCVLPDVVLTSAEESCMWEQEGGECRYGGAGAEGVCVVSRSVNAEVFGGAGRMDMPLFKCVRPPKEREAEGRAGALLVGGAAGGSALLALGLWFWQRRRRRAAE